MRIQKELFRAENCEVEKRSSCCQYCDRSLVDEEAMAKALKSRKVDTYVLEAEDLTSPPLGGVENAVLFKGFGWYTKEALEKNKEIWIENIEAIVEGKLKNSVN